MLNYFKHIEFASPNAFFLFIFPGIFLIWHIWRAKRLYPTLTLPILAGLKGYRNPVRGFIKKNLFILRAIALGFLILALARPQTSFNEEEVSTEGIDIVIALDVSGSMLARDFQPDRLEAAKKKAEDFLDSRKNDRIGLVVFAGESFTQCPLTIDHQVVKKLLSEIKNGLIEDGTAIGMGLATSISRLKESETQSKVVILLTDGVNNAGFIDPLTAVEAALEYGIRVYTIAVGRRGTAPYPVQTPFGTTYQNMEVEIDEELLQQIASETGGKYFRATNNQALENVYKEIDDLEKSKIQVTRISRKTEEFHWFLLMGGLFLLVEILLRYLVVRHIP
ncbi:MAG: VWA domain-containing protein [Bacteroidota bacterium]